MAKKKKANKKNDDPQVVKTTDEAGNIADEGTDTADEVEIRAEPMVDLAGEPDGEIASEVDSGQDSETDPEPEPEPEPELSIEEQLRRERDELKDKWLRTVAEMDNVRKRSRRDVVDARRFALADLVRSLLEVQDDFERAMGSFSDKEQKEAPDIDAFHSGIELIYKRLVSVLSNRQVQKIDALGQQFDPNLHEAVGQLEKDGTESGQVIEIVQEGYMLQDLVLRPSRVIIAQ